ncbi:DEAD/DEAH box helicase [Sphaerotilus sp.]|uniref:DEAD/DEAH box helicase n=1 Tax=Sphaerotilus sp. TaxID=2093942 RepID=UPI002ACE6E1B|nr:DEAD/DEAH box helicase family protein [Sphaerotilus sp.]MDZ7857503.1 DEAD/DEAH box helicase family protein [Sphaerotilus sp.]
MALFTLKDYQLRALDALEGFFRRLNIVGREAAWAEAMAARHGAAPLPAYDARTMGDTPAVCVRLPTGGGKTTLAAHAVARVGHACLGTQAPVALWLVPSTTILVQTLAALRIPGNPCHEGLAEHFGDRVRVCALDELATVGPHELGASAIVVVATIQSFNVKETRQRNVYSVDEALAPHFQNLAPQQTARLEKVSAADLDKQPYLTLQDIGRVKSSLANWLALHRPLVIVDEAHNNRTQQAFETLNRLAPACLVELTATPVKGSNVVFHVGAQELQREDMIKLPIVLMEHPTGWQEAVRDAILTRARLERLAEQHEVDYLRPVLLFQAQPKGGGEATVEALLAHLTSADGEKLPRHEIAVATGDQKELDGVQIGSPLCPIRYVVTVEALKEGWDCPFAYVLCSLQNVHSAKDVEQLLGRVLRMPYARPRKADALNKAYAHVVSDHTARVADELTDRLVNNMGFDAYEAVQAIVSAQMPLPGTTDPAVDDGPLFATATSTPRVPDAIVSLPVMPSQPLPPELVGCIELRPTTAGASAIVRGEITEAVEAFLLSGCTAKQQTAVTESIQRERLRQSATLAPSALGVPFAPLLQLGLEWDGEWQRLDRRLCAELGDFDLFAEPVALAAFAVVERGHAFEIGVEGGHVTLTVKEAEQLYLNDVPGQITEHELVRWLDRECRQVDLAQPVMLRWLLAVVLHLQRDRGLSLTALVRSRYPLAEALRRDIERRRQNAVVKGFQQALPGLVARAAGSARSPETPRNGFTFHPDRYAGRPPFYAGRYRFSKHYYGNDRIHDLRERTEIGKQLGEEFLCARAIDMERRVRHWVRNVERDERFSFWLPTATGYFYPDFVAELIDGRVMVIEYKGGQLATNDDSRHKAQIGEHWAAQTGGLFLMAVSAEKDPQGREVAQQIADRIEVA